MPTTRVQLALNVDDLQAATDFYTKLFGVAPHKQRAGYANFAIEDPPLKLVLFEAPDATRRSTTLASRQTASRRVAAADERFQDAGSHHPFDHRGPLLSRRPRQGLRRRALTSRTAGGSTTPSPTTSPRPTAPPRRRSAALDRRPLMTPAAAADGTVVGCLGILRDAVRVRRETIMHQPFAAFAPRAELPHPEHRLTFDMLVVTRRVDARADHVTDTLADPSLAAMALPDGSVLVIDGRRAVPTTWSVRHGGPAPASDARVSASCGTHASTSRSRRGQQARARSD